MSKEGPVDDKIQRRANPPGWTQPLAPYNPYDINDARPPGGYPSEFKAPGRQSSFSEIPRDLTEYQLLRNNMNRLKYTPRPRSDLYPGQYKVLRRTGTIDPFERGVIATGTVFAVAVVTISVFFVRWNEGSEHIFSAPYRAQLRARDFLFGNLTEEQREELQGSKPVRYGRFPNDSRVPPNFDQHEDEMALQRPTKRHVLEVERLRQEEELALMKSPALQEPEKSRKKWLGIF